MFYLAMSNYHFLYTAKRANAHLNGNVISYNYEYYKNIFSLKSAEK